MTNYVDPHKVNLAEKDIEDYIFAHPEVIKLHGMELVTEWTERQFSVPSGIIDILGISRWNTPIVVEVKNVPFESKHLTQVFRYARDIQTAYLAEEPDFAEIEVWKILIGPYIPETPILIEADAMGIYVLQTTIKFSMETSLWGFSKEFMAKRLEKFGKLSQCQTFSKIKLYQDVSKTIDKKDAE